MNSRKALTVDKGQEGIRLDIWLARQLKEMSRSRIQQLIRAGLVTINARPVKESHKIKPGERIEVNIPPPRPVELKAEKIPLNILFEDDALIVVDKPAGMVVHPAPGHNSGTLVNAILHHCQNLTHIFHKRLPADEICALTATSCNQSFDAAHIAPCSRLTLSTNDASRSRRSPKGGDFINRNEISGLSGIGGELRPGIVHRLDKDTSGVMVVAKTEKAIASLAGQFKRREIHKEYLAVVRGVLSPPGGIIETMIGRHATDRKKMTAVPRKGRPAVTGYDTMETLGNFSLVRLKPETGRTHQLRVHLAHVHHPVIGDEKYSRRSAWNLPVEVKRQMLHAHKISFRHPDTGKKMEFSAPVPEDMVRLLDYLRYQA